MRLLSSLFLLTSPVLAQLSDYYIGEFPAPDGGTEAVCYEFQPGACPAGYPGVLNYEIVPVPAELYNTDQYDLYTDNVISGDFFDAPFTGFAQTYPGIDCDYDPTTTKPPCHLATRNRYWLDLPNTTPLQIDDYEFLQQLYGILEASGVKFEIRVESYIKP